MDGLQVVLVSINYRLNGFGFMALDELSRHDSRGVSGNYGVTDMIASLEVTAHHDPHTHRKNTHAHAHACTRTTAHTHRTHIRTRTCSG